MVEQQRLIPEGQQNGEEEKKVNWKFSRENKSGAQPVFLHKLCPATEDEDEEE